MDIYSEIDLSTKQHREIQTLRNKSFPEHQVDRSYYEQLPHMRGLKYLDGTLVGHMGLDFRVVSVGEEVYKVLGVVDFCVDRALQGQGIGTSMLSQLSGYVETKDVDFIILISELNDFYTKKGYRRIDALSSWLRLHEHKNYGVTAEKIDSLYVKPVGDKNWRGGSVDWLGYLY